MSQTTKPAKRGRHTVARHGELRSPGPLTALMKFLGIALAVVLVSSAGVAAYAAYDLTESFTSGAVALEGQNPVPPDIGAIEGGVNLFVAGTDACEPAYARFFGDRCKGPDAGGELNDVNMLVHISDAPRRVTVISFPRDLIVPVPSCTRKDGSESSPMSAQALNATYSIGGLSCIVRTVSQLSGLNIPFAAKVTWGGVIQVTDAIGGVQVCLASGIKDPYTGINWPAGTRTVKGFEALQFLRTRHGVGDGSDLGRISNQQQYMSRLARKLMSGDVLSNPALLYKLASTAVRNITPSQSLTNPLTLVQIALAVKNVPFNDIVFVQYPTLEDPSDPNRVIPNLDAASVLWKALAENKPLKLTGAAGSNGGVVVETPKPGSTPTASPTPTTTPTPGQTSEAAVNLPSSITGTTPAQETCSNGNQRRNG